MPLFATASIGERHAYFEPVHGGAPDIAGRGVANPIGAMLSAAMMVTYRGHAEAGRRIVSAVISAVTTGAHTLDLGGSHTTEQFTDEVCRQLA
jgi:isocitrate/isopropylmalate dehydrogenase